MAWRQYGTAARLAQLPDDLHTFRLPPPAASSNAISPRICAVARLHSASMTALPTTISAMPSVVVPTGSQTRRLP
jgi:hypothetical protein